MPAECKNGPGYKTPLDALVNGPREKILYVICIQPDGRFTGKPDYLATVDVDPESPQYCKVIHRTKALYGNDEWHHFGWNACSSCFNDPKKKRDKLVIPSLLSNRIYILDVSQEQKPTIHKVIEPEEILKFNVGTLHTTHCLGTGEVMISALGDRNGEPKGDFLLLNADTWEIKGLWTKGEKIAKFGYDFWYQPYHDVMISSEWEAPKAFTKGFKLEEIMDTDLTGRSLNIYSWSRQQLLQTIDLGEEGITPLEVKFLHDPTEAQGYVCCAYPSNVFRFFKKDDGSWAAEKVIDIPNVKVDGWCLPEVPGLITALLLSVDDRYLYLSNWLHGDIRQYDIQDRAHPKLTGQIFVGGLLVQGGPIKVLGDQEQPSVRQINGTRVYGGPQMLQLSLDGKRLYATTSLFTVWDTQFYPDMIKNGSVLMKIDVNTDEGGLKLDENFLVDFGKEPDGPMLAHECRYPGGDCTSDIWLNCCS